MSAPTPAPPPGSGPTPRRPRRRVLLIVLVSVLAVGLVCCGGAGFALYRYLDDSPTSPEEAVDEWLTALQKRDVARAEDALCSKDDQASREVVDRFYATVVRPGNNLEAMQWTIASKKRTNSKRYALSVEITVDVSNAQGRFTWTSDDTLEAVDDSRKGWTVCDVR